MAKERNPQLATADLLNAQIGVLFRGVVEVETLLLQLPTNTDRFAVPFIQESLRRATHELTAAFYASGCLATAIERGDKDPNAS